MTTEPHFLLLGTTGQLGWELHRTLAPLAKLTVLDFPEVDFRQPESLRNLLMQVQPTIIFNAVAYTDVEKAESEPKTANDINAAAPGLLAEYAISKDSLLIHYSTDFVFDGTKGSPYRESDPPNPINIYGKTKLKGEQAIQAINPPHIILRTSWVYSFRRPSIATKVLQWAHNQDVVRVADDQIGSPTWCRTLAETTSLLVARLGEFPIDLLAERSGIYHLAGRGSASRYQFAKALLKYDPQPQLHRAQKVEKAQAADFPTRAERPANSSLDCTTFENTFNLQLPPWDFSSSSQLIKLNLEDWFQPRIALNRKCTVPQGTFNSAHIT